MDKLSQKLENRKKEGTIRSLSCFVGFIDFYSNDYLGLSSQISKELISSKGATGSRLISGNSKEAIECEKYLSYFFQTEAALVFNSGYQANLGFFSCVPQREDSVFYDEKIHASVRDGIRLSNAKSYSFKHNSIEDLKSKLKLATGTIYVAVESLYSMDGDFSPLVELSELSKEFNFRLVVDEAHSVGLFGENGKGLVNELQLESQLFCRIVTFGKAYGFHGAAVLGSQTLIDYLINFSRPFIYTTALPTGDYNTIKKNLEIKNLQDRRLALQENLKYFIGQMNSMKLISNRRSPIQMLRIGDVNLVKEMADELNRNQIAVKPIYAPTVPKGEESLRICLHAQNTKQEIDLLVSCINLSLSHFK